MDWKVVKSRAQIKKEKKYKQQEVVSKQAETNKQKEKEKSSTIVGFNLIHDYRYSDILDSSSRCIGCCETDDDWGCDEDNSKHFAVHVFKQTTKTPIYVCEECYKTKINDRGFLWGKLG